MVTEVISDKGWRLGAKGGIRPQQMPSNVYVNCGAFKDGVLPELKGVTAVSGW